MSEELKRKQARTEYDPGHRSFSDENLMRLAVKHRRDPELYRDAVTGEIDWRAYRADNKGFYWWANILFVVGIVALFPLVVLAGLALGGWFMTANFLRRGGK